MIMKLTYGGELLELGEGQEVYRGRMQPEYSVPNE